MNELSPRTKILEMGLTLAEAETAKQIMHILRYDVEVSRATPEHFWVFGEIAGRRKIVAMSRVETEKGKRVELGDLIEVDCDQCPSSITYVDAIILSLCKSSAEIRLNCPECSFKTFANEKVRMNQFSAE